MKYTPLKNFLGKPLKLQTGNFYSEEELEDAVKKFEAQFDVKNCAIGNEATEKIKESGEVAVCGSLPLSEVIKGEEGKYYCGLLDGKDMISTQGKTIDEVFENMADAYRTIKGSRQ